MEDVYWIFWTSPTFFYSWSVSKHVPVDLLKMTFFDGTLFSDKAMWVKFVEKNINPMECLIMDIVE